MTCIINPYPQEISQDEFLLILNSNDLYPEYRSLVDNDANLEPFFTKNNSIIQDSIKSIKTLRDLLQGKSISATQINNNKVINYFLNNDVNQNILNTIDEGFINHLYSNLIDGNSILDLIPINDLFTLPANKSKNNSLVYILSSLVFNLKKTLTNELNNPKLNLTEYEKEFKQRTINYINSLNLSENFTKPITTKNNFQNNTRLRQLINFLGRDGLFKLDSNKIDAVNNEIDELENNIQIYDKDPLTENPSDKISTRLKLLLRGIPQYDSTGKERVKINNTINKYWKPADLLLKLLTRVSGNKIHNLTLTQILNRLEILSNNSEDPLAKPTKLFLDKLYTVVKNQEVSKNTSPDILTDLFIYFQQMPVGIKFLEEKIQVVNGVSKSTVVVEDATKFQQYQLNQTRLNIKNDLINNTNINEYLDKPLTLTSQKNLLDTLVNVLKNSVNDNTSVIQKNIEPFLKINETFNENTLTNIIRNVVSDNNILNTAEVNKVYNINNDTLYPVIKPSELSEKISIINTSINQIKAGLSFNETDFYKTFQDDIIINSIWADYIQNGGQELKISIFTGIKTLDTTKEWSDFTDGEFLGSFFNLMMSNLYHTPVLSDKSNIYVVEGFKKVIQNLGSNLNVFKQNQDKQNKIPYFDDIISFLEIDSILNEEKSKGSISRNVDSALDTQKLFLFIPEIYNLKDSKGDKITNEQVLDLYNNYKNSPDLQTKQKAQFELNTIIHKFFNQLGKNYLDLLIENNYVKEDPNLNFFELNPNQDIIKDNTGKYSNPTQGSENLLTDIRTAAIKSFIYSTHISLLANGHPAFFKQNDEQKRTKAVVADTIKPNIEATYKGERIFKENTNPVSRRIILKDVEKAVVNEIAEQFMLQDLQNKKVSEETILTEMSKIFSNYTLLDGTPIFTLEKESFNKLKEEYNNKVSEINANNDLSEEEKNSKLDTLKNEYLNKEKLIKHNKTTLSNTTDASSVASLDHARTYGITLNMYSDDQEEFYNAEKQGKSLKKFTKNNFKIVKNTVFTKVKTKNVDSGLLLTHMEKTSTDNFTAQRVFIGETPNLYQAMIGKMFGYTFNEATKSWSYNPSKAITDKVVYESAVKAEMLTDNKGNPIIFDLQKEIQDKNITSLNDVNNWKPEENFIDNYVISIPFTEDRLQVETPEHLEAEGDLGTQIEALINNSIDINETYSIGNKFFTGQELTQIINSLKITMTNLGQKRVKEYFSDIEKLQELVLELYNDRDYLNPETLTLEKLEELLKNQQFGLALVPKLQSVIKKNVVKTKMNTVQFFNGVTAEDESLRMITETVTNSEGKEIKQLVFEVAVPAFSEDIFNSALNENNELDANLLPNEVKDLIVYRIPTEAVYSMFVVRIKKLLHPAAGPIIYMPIGTTTIAGFDMDIDKLFGILKNYKVNKKGKIQIIPYSLEQNNNINFKEWFKENITDADRQEQMSLFEQKNKLIENNQELLNANKELKTLLTKKNNIIQQIINNLNDNLTLTDEELNNELLNILKNNEEFLDLKTQLEIIYKSNQFDNLNVVKESFKEIDDSLASIEKLYKDNWKKLSLTEQMSSKQLQNLNFDIIKGVVGSQINSQTYLQGNNADRLKEIKKTIQPSALEKLFKQFPYKDRSITNALNTFKAIMSGAKNIGPTAINNQFIAYLKFLYNLNPTNNNLGLTLGGNLKVNTKNKENKNIFNLFRGINNFKTMSGNTANIANAVLLAQAVDNIKEDLSVDLNLHKNLMGTRALMYVFGIDENIADRIFTNIPKINNLIKSKIKDGSINKFKSNIFKGIGDLKSNTLVKKTLIPDSSEFTYELNLDLLQKKFKENENILDTLNLESDDILLLLEVLQDLSNEMNDLVQTMNYFYKGFGKNFNELIYAYINTNNFLNNTENKNLNLNIEGSFIEHKLKTLRDLSNEVYKIFNINLDNPLLNTVLNNSEFKNTFFKPKYLGYLYNALNSSNLYINLLAQFGSAENLKNAYFKEVTDLMFIFGQNNIVEQEGLNYVKSPNQNNMLGILQNIVKFNRNSQNIFFVQNINDFISENNAYKNNLSFLGQVETIDTVQTPKSIIDLMSIDNQTLFQGSNSSIKDLTPQEVFSAQDIAKKLFFVNMVQSALFNGKTNRGRSNVFDLLFLDNTLLQNELINSVQGSLYELLTPNPEFLENLYSNEILQTLYNFAFINNSELFLKNTFDTELRMKNNIVTNQILTMFRNSIENDVIYLDEEDIEINQDLNEKVIARLTQEKNKFFKQKFVIIPFTQNNVKYQYLFKAENPSLGLYKYTNLGIVNNFNPKINPINFNVLNNVVNNLSISENNYVPVEISQDTFIKINPNYRSYGIKKDILTNNITETEQELLNTATGVISVIDPTLKNDFSTKSINLKPYNAKFVRVTAPTQPTVQPVGKVKEDVSELFDSNPELANTVYEALGFKVSNSSISLNKINNTKVGEVVTLFINNMPVKYKRVSENYFEGKQITKKQETDFINSVEATTTPIEEFIEREGVKVRYSLDEFINFYLDKLPKTQITPQQKQQAQQLYSQYLDTVFPESKVKDIVYRADKRTDLTPQTTVDDFTQVYVNGVYYTTELDYANNYNKVLNGKIYPTLLNIINPAEIKTKKDIERLGRNKIEFEKINKLKYSTNPKDSLIFDNNIYKTEDKYGEVGKEIVVFEPEQIYILGSKQDVEGFKEFVKKTNKKVSQTKDSNLRFKFNTDPNETILLTKSFANKDSLSDETKKMINGHIKLGNKFIFSSNTSNKIFLEYLIDKKYTNFEIFGQNSKNDMSESDINLLLSKLNVPVQSDLTDTTTDENSELPDCA